MKIALVAFSPTGGDLALRMSELRGHDFSLYLVRRHQQDDRFRAFDSVYELTARIFDRCDALVFISAAGIAVRAIAPLIKSKLTDPAVVVTDECGRFVISLLSGHAGGANRLTQELADLIAATAVITTASDSHALAAGRAEPRNLILGIGCRRGLPAETIERAATIMLWDQRIPLLRVRELATIELKRDEQGLLAFAAAHQLPLRFYSAADLAAVAGDFSPSDWVLQKVGVDNVCERAAVLSGGRGQLIMKKTARDGVTVAVFEEEQ